MNLSAIPLLISICLGFFPDVDGESIGSNTTLTVPDWCFGYKVLDRADRSRGNVGCHSDQHDCYCDVTGLDYTSSDWQGSGYYRFLEPAGTRIPESPPFEERCGTNFPGWINGKHPEGVGQIVDLLVCFSDSQHSPGNYCGYKTYITATNCGEYFVYSLSNTESCMFRYCGE